jgi:hypothetical protein
MPGIQQAMLCHSGGGGGPTPSASEIIVTGNAEIEAAANDIFTFSGSIASGVTDAHGRVYDNGTFIMQFTYPGGSEEFVSAGVRLRIRTDASDDLLRFRDAGSSNHIKVIRHTDDTWRVTNNGGTLLGTAGTTTLSTLTWYYVTLYARIHATLGEFTAKLFDASGALLETISGSGIDTQNSATFASITAWGGASADTYVDQLWTDITGAFRGCGFVETSSPVSNGDTNAWTRGGTDTGNNWDQVDEVPKNTTSYVFSTGADQVELYNHADKSQAGSIVTVQQVVYAHAHSAGTREWKPICKIGGVVYEGPTQSTTSTSTGTVPTLIKWDNNPATGSPWLDAEYNAAQLGAKSVTTDVRLQAHAIQILIDIAS